MTKPNKRREVIKNLALGTGLLTVPAVLQSCETRPKEQKPEEAPQEKDVAVVLKGNINHSACRWCYNSIPLEEFFEKSAAIGLKAIDLLTPQEWALAKKYGLECSMGTDSFANIENGFNDPANHTDLQQKYSGLITKAAEAGVKNIICFSGNRRELDDQTGIENCATGLKPLVEQAEKEGVTIFMELLNSKVNHPDYQCDHTPWGVALAEKIASPNFKLLYDIYHMQIMEGDVIATIKKYHHHIGHYHTGGVPGRNEINNTQELYYPAIMKAILDTGFNGYVAQEFVPTYPDKMAALKEGVLICDV
ncbi:hydroxypyruvate isomerase family protein [Abyssalbus ytuae]|uniref:TIM barrel protein n=1 Tax=Abyssalbus ytuae TaxID=2926907 RepID=A0A9E7D365_9FLAO|nr:TIM barrel protein [Abyssalbus ytuae]UOB18953.1 TIM barrel protein [Abyssalbus ytuae]